MNSKPTKQQREAITAAYRAICYLSETTNWSDPHAWQEAIKAERRQGLNAFEAKANCIKAWRAGASNPDTPARDIFGLREGYLKAFLLGVRHRHERAESEYTGPIFEKAMRLAEPAVDAWHTIIHGGK